MAAPCSTRRRRHGRGKADNVPAAQRAFAHRARMNGLAALGQWKADLEKGGVKTSGSGIGKAGSGRDVRMPAAHGPLESSHSGVKIPPDCDCKHTSWQRAGINRKLNVRNRGSTS